MVALAVAIAVMKHLLLSKNDATGWSLNFDPELTCALRCCYCYAQKLTASEAETICSAHGLPPRTILANNGPITWHVQQAAYRRNVLWLESRTQAQIAAEARYQALALHRKQPSMNSLRHNGCGDCTSKSALLAYYMGWYGVQGYGFSKKERHIIELADLCDSERASCTFIRPHFLLSIDRWTDDATIEARIAAGQRLNRADATLAYMAFRDESPDSIKARWFWRYVRTVLGYHTNHSHTVIGIARECPKTSGKLNSDGSEVTCLQCKRCMTAAKKGA